MGEHNEFWSMDFGTDEAISDTMCIKNMKKKRSRHCTANEICVKRHAAQFKMGYRGWYLVDIQYLHGLSFL